MGDGSGAVGHQTAPRLADRSRSLAAVWLTDVEPLLRSDVKSALEAKLVLEVLRTRYTEPFHPGQARTLERRFREWRRGMASSQRCSSSKWPSPVAKRRSISRIRPTSASRSPAIPFRVCSFEFVLSYSHWTWVAIAFGETFEAHAASVQGALWAIGGVPAVLRSDNLSAATHELKASSGRDLTPRFRAVLEH